MAEASTSSLLASASSSSLLASASSSSLLASASSSSLLASAVICEPVRTPIGRYGGMFKSLTAVELGVAALKGLLERSGLGPDDVEDVILGHCYPSMEAPAIGRVVALDAGLPVTVPGMQLDRRCGSGLQAVIQACMQVGTGQNELVVAGGAESMSNVVFHSTDMRWGGARGGVKVHDALSRGRTTAGGRDRPVPGGMIETAENLRRQYGIPREEQDELAVTSHRRALAAQKDGLLADQIIPVTVSMRQGAAQNETVIDTDEHPRADTSVESLGKLKPILGKQDPEATVTAGNSSGQNDAASMCIVATPEKAAELGLTPLVRLVSWGVAGVPPNVMGIGPVPATEVALRNAGLKLADIDLIELNEAFAAQALAVMREWQFAATDLDRTNVQGSGISLGHPVGATGGRMLATLARELHRRGARYGLETMCIGGGQGLAAVFEKVA
jgi:acetyl-CoA C-acetyltransferase